MSKTYTLEEETKKGIGTVYSLYDDHNRLIIRSRDPRIVKAYKNRLESSNYDSIKAMTKPKSI